MTRENLQHLMRLKKEEDIIRMEGQKITANDLFPHAKLGFFLMCNGCRAVVAMGANRTQEETCLGAVQEGWTFNRDVYCPKCR